MLALRHGADLSLLLAYWGRYRYRGSWLDLNRAETHRGHLNDPRYRGLVCI
jgi:hypothetical protein